MALLFVFLTFPKQMFKNHRTALEIFLTTSLLTAYLFIGGGLLRMMEAPQEENGHKAVSQVMSNIKVKYPNISDTAIKDLFKQLTDIGIKGLPQEQEQHNPKWTYGNTVFFCITLCTTIGYGHLSPLTVTGKILTIVYSSIGIPLTLLMMSLYATRLTAISTSFKVYLFQKLKKRCNPIEISFLHVSIIIVLIMSSCFLIPAAVFQYMEGDWSYMDSLYYCFITLSTVGLGDFVPGVNSTGPYADLYRISSGLFIVCGVTVMMTMVSITNHFYKHCNDDITINIAIHEEKLPINVPEYNTPNYGSVCVQVSNEEEHQKLLQT